MVSILKEEGKLIINLQNKMKNIIEAKNISKIYETGKVKFQALKDINFSMNQGEFVAIIGRSGSGKTTLLNILAGLDQCTQGSVVIDGTNITELSQEECTKFRRNKIGFVFQSYQLISVLTAKDNIELLENEKNHDYLNNILSALEIADLKDRYPDELSGGQQQRVAIARALINHPNIILADEPTGNLDSKSEQKVMKLLKELVQTFGTSILMITHNVEIAKDADRIIRLEDGEFCNE